MKTYNYLWQKLCSLENLELAFKKARKHKTQKLYVIEFEKNLKDNLLLLRTELLLHSYRPKPLITFIVHDPKNRKISKSDFRDRVVHHALCNIIEPIFEKSFIYDSYANRIGKGTLKAIHRFDLFKKKVSKNNSRLSYVLKSDIKHYFDTVNHEILIKILTAKIKDKKIIWLIKIILSNYSSHNSETGMPLGNLTSQFLANVYLNELDQFVKRELKAKYYLRYVDDFVILADKKQVLDSYQEQIVLFLKKLKLELHPHKTRIIGLSQGINFLGFRLFSHHRLMKKRTKIKLLRKLDLLRTELDGNQLNYDLIYASFEGWLVYAKIANTFSFRTQMIELYEKFFSDCISTKEIKKAVS